MYKKLDVVAAAEARAQSLIIADRMRFRPFMEAIELYASENDVIIGGESATRLLLGRGDEPAPVDINSFTYNIYSGQANQHARRLADKLYAVDPEGLGHYTTTLTKVADYYYTIAVDGRDLVTVTSLAVHRGVRTADVVIPTPRPGQFLPRKQLQCMGPEIQLMQIYAAMCDPGRADEWAESLQTEVRLRELFGNSIRAKIAEAVKRVEGGRSERRAKLFRALYKKFVSGPGRVLIGAAALEISLGRSPNPDSSRLQLVTSENLEKEAKEIASIAAAVGIEVQWTTNDPKIPTDPRLRRLTVSIIEGRDQRIPVMDVYNAGAHELIPFVGTREGASGGAVDGGRRHRAPSQDSIGNRDHDFGRAPGVGGVLPPNSGLWDAPHKIGTPFVLMRFRLADMWTIQVLMQMGAINTGYAKNVLHEMLADFERMVTYYEHEVADAKSDPERAARILIPLDTYTGRLESPELALKRAMLKKPGAHFHAPYMPAARAPASASASAPASAPASASASAPASAKNASEETQK
jgi:hypothetical protein